MSKNAIVDVVIIGGGLTGLSAAYRLTLERGISLALLEKCERTGGQIHTYQREGFTYESGPNTGIISTPEAAELLAAFPELVETARPEAKRRLILKQGRFHLLPSSLASALSTKLFTWSDKLRILGEPFRKPGTDPHESVASLVRRRLGMSYFDYAVDPFIRGIYAGDPDCLVTKYALPKLYNLEQSYGSFIKGAIALARKKKTQRERLATREVFSIKGGLSALTDALTECIRRRGMLELGISALTASYLEREQLWKISYTDHTGQPEMLYCRQLLTTVSPKELRSILLDSGIDCTTLDSMRYAPIVQIALGYHVAPKIDFEAFGGLIPSSEDQYLLGILNPSACFGGRCPAGGMMLSAFLGGIRGPEVLGWSDEELLSYVRDRLKRWLDLETIPDHTHIFRHEQAIPQYESSTEQRLATLRHLSEVYPNLHIGGNMHSGIGIPDRIRQGVQLAERMISLVTPK